MMNMRKRKRRRLKFAAFGLLLLILILSTGCTTRLNGDYCSVYIPVYMDYEKDTPETIRQVDQNNVVFWKMCDTE